MKLKNLWKSWTPLTLSLIKFTFEYNAERISFLDLEVNVMKSKLITGLLLKPPDWHKYLCYW